MAKKSSGQIRVKPATKAPGKAPVPQLPAMPEAASSQHICREIFGWASKHAGLRSMARFLEFNC